MFLKTVDAVLCDLGVSKQDCHPTLPRGKEFRMVNPGGGAVSIEEAMFLVGATWVTRPDFVLELGTSMGVSSLIIAAACKDLGKGEVVTVDLAKSIPPTSDLVIKYSLPLTYILNSNSIDYLKDVRTVPKKQYLVFSDTDIPIRPQEVNMVIRSFPQGTVIVVHDTSDAHPFGPMNLKQHVERPIVELPSPRGISILRT